MKKLLGIVVLGLLLSSNAFALTLHCKAESDGQIITDHTFNLSRDSKWTPEYTETHIFWRTWRINPEDPTLAMVSYNSVDRFSGTFKQRVSADGLYSELVKKNRDNTKIGATFIGTCKKTKKKF